MPILALSEYASLVTMKNGEVVLTLGEARFRRGDTLPSTLLTAKIGPELPCTAGLYIEHCLIQQFGADKAGWPPLAQEFLFGSALPDRE